MGNPVMWFEVVGTDGARLRTFYRNLFGWRISDGAADIDYGLVTAEEAGIAGGVGRSHDGGPGHVTFYVEVDDPKTYLDKAQELGGTVIAPPMAVPGFDLTIALLADPDGHLIGLSKSTAQKES